MVLAYVLSQFYRAFLAVLAPTLELELGATPGDLALSSGLWFLAFAVMQIPLGSALVAAAPERMVWGSDWPHTTQPLDTVDDVDLVDVLRVWCASDAVMDRVLVENPAALYGFD